MRKRVWDVLFKGLISLSILLFSDLSFAINGRTTYQARIIKPDGYPLQASSVNFRFTVLDQTGSCVLYVEDYAAINMTDTGGLISFPLGTGARSFPSSGTAQTFQNTFDNSITSFACQTMGIYNPNPTDTRKIVMQFNDGNGWQTLPAMSINAVPYAMFATRSDNSRALNGKADTAFVEYSTLNGLSCAADQAIKYNGVSFSCITVGASATPVTSSTVIAALGYTPAQGASFTSLDSTVTSVSSAVYSVSSTVSNLNDSVTSLSNSVAASFAAMTSSQWSTSGTNIFYNTGNVGLGTTTPVTKLDVSGGVRIGTETTTCAPALAGTLRYNASNVEYCNGTSWQAFGVSGAGITNFNGSTSGTQSFAVGIGGTAPNFNTLNGVHTLNLPLASTGSVTAGLLSNADYTTFSNKITSSAASIAQVLGYVPADNSVSGTYAQKANNLSDLTNIVTARTNLGLGTFATASTIDLGGAPATGTLAIARLPNFTGDATIVAASNTIILSNSGVMAGAYTKVIVDTKGRVTSGAQISSSDVTTALGYTPASATASTQWTTSGANIFYNTGDVGIGTTTPQERLHVSGTMLVTGVWGSGPTLTVSGAGTRMFFYPRKAAFRGGYAYDNEWNEGNLGEGSFAYGDSVAASGSYSVAMGRYSRATAPYATAFGQGDASGDYSTAFDSSTASGLYSFAFGSSSANADRAIAMGGSSSANGESSVAIGRVVISNAYRNVAVGSYNIGNGSGTAWITTDPIFEIGNSQNGLPRTNAMTVLKNGNVGVTVSAPTARLHLASGTTSVAPLKFTTGTLLSSPQSGTMEYDGSNFYLTDSTNTRKTITTGSSAGTIDNASNINSSGNITMTPTGAVVVSSTTASTSSNTGALIVKGGVGIAGDLNVAGIVSSSSQIKATGYRANQGAPNANDSSTNGYSFGADGDTGLFSPGSGAANGIVSIFTNNVEAMRVTPSGVGIGTAAPDALLSVVGAGTRSYSQMMGGAHISWADSATSTNFIGLKIDSPYNSGTSMTGVVRMNRGSSDVYNGMEVGTTTNHPLRFVTNASTENGQERMRIDTAGNVGIGTTNPGSALSIKSSTANNTTGDGFTNLRLEYAGGYNVGNIGAGVTFAQQYVDPGTDAAAIRVGGIFGVKTQATGNFGGGLAFFRQPAGAANMSEAMRIDQNGNLGIGTTSPAEKLDVNGRGRFSTTSAHVFKVTGVGSGYADATDGVATIYSDNTAGSGGNILKLGSAFAPNTFIAKDNGNVGVGTTSPGSKLSVNVNGSYDGIRIDGTNGFLHTFVNAGSGSNNGITQSGDKAIIYGGAAIDSAGGLVIAPWKSNTSGIRMDSAGNVGIGTLTPQGSLHIVSAVSQTNSPSEGIFLGKSLGNDYQLQLTQAGGTPHIDFSRGGNADYDARIFVSSNNTLSLGTTSAGSLVNLSGVNVGIGVTNPQQKLVVQGGNLALNSIGNSSPQYEWRASDNSLRAYISQATETAGTSTDENRFYQSYGFKTFYTQGTERLRIDATGNVGIGTTTPASKLEVRGGNTFMEGKAYVYSNSGWGATTPSISLAIGDNDTGLNWVSDGVLQVYGNNAVRMHFATSGNTGINRADPAYTLDVAGTFRVTGQAYTDTGAATFTVLSDERYKDIHGSYERGLEELLKIGTIRYNYKKVNPTGADSTHEYVGVSAQNVQENIPEAVEKQTSKEGKEFLTVNPSPIIFAMINAFKDMFNKVVALMETDARHDREIASLKAENAELKMKVKEFDELKAYICKKDPQAPNCKLAQ